MAKQINIDRIYQELDKAENPQELTEAVEKIKDFAAKSISQKVSEEEEKIIEYRNLIQKINGN